MKRSASDKKIRYRIFHLRFHRFATIALLCALLGCAHEIVEPEPPALIPNLHAVSISANPRNVLSAIAEVRVEHAHVVAIEYGADSLFHYSTPMVQAGATSTQFAVLGLNANTKYFMRGRAISPTGHHATSAPQIFTTTTLPKDFTSFTVLTNKLPADGLVMLSFIATSSSAKPYAQVITNEGRIVWYREFAQPVVDF